MRAHSLTLGLFALPFVVACIGSETQLGQLSAQPEDAPAVTPTVAGGGSLAAEPVPPPAGGAQTGGTGGLPDAGVGGETSEGGGASTAGGGAGGGATSPAEGGAGAEGGAIVVEPYAPREGTFNVLVYSRTEGFRHGPAIENGRLMLSAIAQANNFEVTFVGEAGGAKDDEENELFTAEGLAQFELVFMLNPTGDVFDVEHEAVFEAWLKNGGAMVGTHSAADCEEDWLFYKELTMQFFDGHSPRGTPGLITFEEEVKDTHPALLGLPNPWSRNEEWYWFDSYETWSEAGVHPGLQILGRLENGQPIMWTREWDTYRAFYTALGHDGTVYEDPEFIQHITGAIMWSVRREHLLVSE